MNGFLRRLRGILGLGLTGGVIGALFGPVAVLLSNHPLFGSVLEWGLPTSVTGWALFGALSGSGFGVMLTLTAGRRRLDQLSFWKAALLGGAIGVAVPVLVGPQLTWLIPSLMAVVPRTVLCGVFGMLLGSGLVAVAKESERRVLAEADSGVGLLGTPGEGAAGTVVTPPASTPPQAFRRTSGPPVRGAGHGSHPA